MRTLPLLLLLVASPLVAQTAEPSIVPRPVSVTMGHGTFVLEPATVIWADSASAELAAQYNDAKQADKKSDSTKSTESKPASKPSSDS